jgi:hypothetical protein
VNKNLIVSLNFKINKEIQNNGYIRIVRAYNDSGVVTIADPDT